MKYLSIPLLSNYQKLFSDEELTEMDIYESMTSFENLESCETLVQDKG